MLVVVAAVVKAYILALFSRDIVSYTWFLMSLLSCHNSSVDIGGALSEASESVSNVSSISSMASPSFSLAEG
jgi:hypothetical protein